MEQTLGTESQHAHIPKESFGLYNGDRVDLDDGNDPVCIVGAACRLPGGIRSPSGLWDFLLHGKSAQADVPMERFNIKGFHCTDSEKAGTMNVKGGYFLSEDIRQFENGFFGIHHLEATFLDPQQRKLLEVVYECFESAGTSMDAISGSNTGVYVGNFTNDHAFNQARDADHIRRYQSTGCGPTMMASRISHAFNLHGPSLTLDTACSSSIHCLHVAVAALEAKECDGAIIAGANLIFAPESFLVNAKSGTLSATSSCRTFDVSADGYGRAEGVSAVYLKRLSSAMRNKDNIRAVIRGTAINSDGKTPGITLPSADLQEAVIRKAYSNAGLEFSDTDYIECHGTGTPVGDPIEAEALRRCFSSCRTSTLKIGSVKPNVGHSEATSGLTSLIKIILSFQHGLIPPTRGVSRLNPALGLLNSNLEVVTEIEEWPRDTRRASINSFGYGGSNAHAIIESLDSYLGATSHQYCPSETVEKLFVLPISTLSRKSLPARIFNISQIAKQCDITTLERLAHTLSERRSNMRTRSYLIASSRKERNSKEVPAEAAEPRIADKVDPLPFAFIFTGQGAQYTGLAKELLEQSPVFLATILELDKALQTLPVHAPRWTLQQTLTGESEASEIHHVTRSQPVCTAIQIALVNLLRSWGVHASAVLGHSSGEIAAAYSAGLMSASQAIIVAYLRGHAVNQIQNSGAMMAVGLSVDAANDLIKEIGLGEKICIACINSPGNVTFSGHLKYMDTLTLALQSRNIFYRRLETGGQAYHSEAMKEVGPIYESLLNSLLQDNFGIYPVTATMYSSVGYNSDELVIVDGSIQMTKYWRENLEKPVQFNASFLNLLSSQKYHLIEIGPHSTLRSSIFEIQSGMQSKDHLPYSPTLIRNQDANLCTKKLAGTLFSYGYKLNWLHVNDLSQHNYTPLYDIPPYPWDYSAGLLWFESRASLELRNRPYPRHELLGSQQLTGNGIDWNWRNVLRLTEIPWIRDHKVESQIVFPAAGYLALAVEAVTQIRGLQFSSSANHTSFEFQNVNINTAFVVPDEGNRGAESTELHTTMSLRKISGKNTSSDIFDFSISSWAAHQTAIHCTGSVRVVQLTLFKDTVTIQNTDRYRILPMNRWYEKLREEGLCFGPHLQSVTSLCADSNQIRSDTICTTHIMPPISNSSATFYPVHPITIDACLQATIMSAAAGNINSFRAYLPVFISECHIQTPNYVVEGQEAVIHARSRKTGFSTLKADCTMRATQGRTMIDMKNVRISMYTGKVVKQEDSNSTHMQRNPVMRVHWKPDIRQLYPGTEKELDEYITTWLPPLNPDLVEHEISRTVEALIDLAGHKNPRMDVLAVTNVSDNRAEEWLRILDYGSAFPRCRSWHTAALEQNGEISINSGGANSFDLLVHEHIATQTTHWNHLLKTIDSTLNNSGIVVTRNTPMSLEGLHAAGFRVMVVRDHVLLAQRVLKPKILTGRDVVILTHEPSPTIIEFAFSLASYLRLSKHAGKVNNVSLTQLDQDELSSKTVCISLLETEKEFLATMTQEHMDLLRRITDSVLDLVWLTGAGMLDKPDPNLTLASGLSRAMMKEQPSILFTVVDIGSTDTLKSNIIPTCENIGKIYRSCRDKDDKEFIQHKSLLYVSRLGSDLTANSLFRRRLGFQEFASETTLAAVSPARLCVGKAGVTDTIYFQQLREPATTPPSGFVDVAVKAISLNAKDVYVMSGRVETQTGTSAMEFSGVVTAVGADVTHLKPGDRIVVCAPNSFSTTERVPAWTAHKLLPSEDFTVIATLPTIFSAALYALRDRAHLRAGESVLIHSGAGAFGIAAIMIAKRLGAVIYTTVGSSVKRDFLVSELGIPVENIFQSRNESFVEDVNAATQGKGVDIIINSLAGDLMHASWRCIANFGRFVEIGKRELVDAGKLEMYIFSRNTTFTAFDLSDLFFHEDRFYQHTFKNLVAEVLHMYRSEQIRPVPIRVFDVADISQAYRYFSSKDRIGKVAISLESSESRIQAAPSKYTTTFDPSKTYLLVGCLGGLGRSLSSWMVTRGARKFVFLGRSGCDKPNAEELVTRLRSDGAYVAIVRGDVSQIIDVKTAVTACLSVGNIGGVVQAAMGLHEDIFSRMSNEGWHESVRPKWAGTWNLHTALEGHDQALDFFLLTSSQTGTVGTPTESNYCAANAFLDAFAQWRRFQGKPAVSVGLGMISEVGYLHENPEIESLLLRRGAHPLNEEEFLQIADLAISGVGDDFERLTHTAAHILTGMETFGVRKLLEQGFEVGHMFKDDPRVSILSAGLEADTSPSGTITGGISDLDRLITTVPWLKGLPRGAAEILIAEADAPSLKDSIMRMVGKSFSSLVLMPIDQIDYHKSFEDFGVDSMIASEFRTWFWNTFKVDVPFLSLLSAQSSLDSVAGLVERNLLETKGD